MRQSGPEDGWPLILDTAASFTQQSDDEDDGDKDNGDENDGNEDNGDKDGERSWWWRTAAMCDSATITARSNVNFNTYDFYRTL